jgi:hypothetical protein
LPKKTEGRKSRETVPLRVGVGSATRCGSGFDQVMRLLAAPALQHCKLGVAVRKRSLLVGTLIIHD